MDLGGGLEVAQVSTFEKLWSALQGGDTDLGATFFRPSSIPAGFFPLGCYAQTNAAPLFGWVLVARDIGPSVTGVPPSLAEPVDYSLVWSSSSDANKKKLKQDGAGSCYLWLPVPPEGYHPVGLLVTTSPEKPSLGDVRCVRDDLTDECEPETAVWSTPAAGGVNLNMQALRPKNRGVSSPGVRVGTFGVDGVTTLRCLKNVGPTLTAAMPSLEQITALAKEYAPIMCFHPKETYLPCSVDWFFSNGALLYDRSETLSPSPVKPDGSNLPLGGSNDGAYWIDLPTDAAGRDRLKRGDLGSASLYLHVKPMLGGTFTDLAAWVFYPFNGPGTLKLGAVDIPLGRTGEHVGDWEHVTLRVSNLTGELWRVYFSQHSSGLWVDASQVEFAPGPPNNRPVAYASRSGHAFYPHPGLVLQGSAALGVGIRNDTATDGPRVDAADEGRMVVVAVDHLPAGKVPEPAWVEYFREWGPKITYTQGCCTAGCSAGVLNKVISGLPSELFGQEGPTGPKEKSNWSGDEK